MAMLIACPGTRVKVEGPLAVSAVVDARQRRPLTTRCLGVQWLPAGRRGRELRLQNLLNLRNLLNLQKLLNLLDRQDPRGCRTLLPI